MNKKEEFFGAKNLSIMLIDLLGLPPEFYNEKILKNTYLTTDLYPDLSDKIYLLYEIRNFSYDDILSNYPSKSVIKDFNDMRIQLRFKTNIYETDWDLDIPHDDSTNSIKKYYCMFMMKIPKTFHKDFNLFLEGKYSKLSDQAKFLIHKGIKSSNIYKIFNKDKEMLKYWEEKINIPGSPASVDLSNMEEYLSKIDLLREHFNEFKYTNKYQTNKIV